MPHDVFISYSSKDKPVADAICATVESAGIRCWIAPRDISPGEDWPSAITKAIRTAKILVLVFSKHANSSDEVSRELMLAASHKLIIIPFRIEDVEPEPGMQYYLARTHWLDAINPPLRAQIDILIERLQAILGIRVRSDGGGDPHPGPKPQGGRASTASRRILAAAVFALCAVGLALAAAFLLPTFFPAGIPSITAEATPTRAPRPVGAGYTDDYSDPGSGWSVESDMYSERKYQDGEYVIQVGQSGPGTGLSELTFQGSGTCKLASSPIDLAGLSSYSIDVDVRRLTGHRESAYGIVFHFVDATQFLFYDVSPDGFWSLSERTANGWYDMVLATQNPQIRSGTAVNHLRLEVTDFVKFYINGRQVDSRALYNPRGGAALWADNCFGDLLTVAFDNFVLAPLE